jgi:MoCo/4Fe-4S cofactor protein with predicted Tat translocation signal
MKRKVEHPAPSERATNGPALLAQPGRARGDARVQGALEREFPEGASSLDGVDRRQFMKIMAASFALGGIGARRLPAARGEHPSLRQVGRGRRPRAAGLLRDGDADAQLGDPAPGRDPPGPPDQARGQSGYAPHGGASSLLAQASILDLYDPGPRDRPHPRRQPDRRGGREGPLLAGRNRRTRPRRAPGLAFLAESRPRRPALRLVAALRRQVPEGHLGGVRAGDGRAADGGAARAVFGANLRPLYRFAKAKRIVSLDADFLQAEAGSLYYARDFAKGRRVTRKDDPMNRLYVAESNLTITGTMADHRLRLASSHMVAFAAALAPRSPATRCTTGGRGPGRRK